MNTYLVTLKLPKNPEHDPRNKKTGPCPASGELCTDVTGEHHTVLVTSDESAEDVRNRYLERFHVTRVERA